MHVLGLRIILSLGAHHFIKKSLSLNFSTNTKFDFAFSATFNPYRKSVGYFQTVQK